MKAVTYARVSSREQADSGLGLAAQAERNAAYCRMKGLVIVREFVDAGESCGVPIGERPAGRELMDYLRTGEAANLVIMRLDRGFGDAVDCLSAVRGWDAAGIVLHIVDLGGSAIASNTAAGRFMLTVMAAAAEMRLNVIRENTRNAMRQLIQQGKTTGLPRFGWKAGKGGYLVPDPAEQKVIQQIREWRQAGHSLYAIARKLNEAGIPTKRKERIRNPRRGVRPAWTINSIDRILSRSYESETQDPNLPDVQAVLAG